MSSKAEVSEIKGPEVVAVEKKKTRLKSGKPSLKHSNFFLLINTQKNVFQMPEEEVTALKTKFREVMKGLFVEIENKFLIMEGSKEGEELGLPKNCSREELWKRVEGTPKVEFCLEIGPQSGKLHSHATFTISKRGLNTKLDYAGISAWVNEQMGFTCHFNSKVFRDAKADIREYISKDPVL